MQKNFKLEESLYNKLKAEADKNFRTLSGQLEYWLSGAAPPLEGKVLGALPVLRGLSSIRTPQDCLRDIRELETQRDEEIMVCQDREYADKIRADYQLKIQPLWDEYHELRG